MATRFLAKVCYVMSYLNPDPASRDVYLSSSAPASVNPGYHEILKPVKGRGVTPPFWGCSVAYKTVGKMIIKLAYWSSGILHNNDKGTLKQSHDAREALAPGSL